MNLQEIENTITELENGDTTFDACIKLSALYNVREHLAKDEVEEELDDILPSYRLYCDTKREYQLGNISKDKVSKSLDDVCREVYEFFLILYRNTECVSDKDKIRDLMSKIVQSIE